MFIYVWICVYMHIYIYVYTEVYAYVYVYVFVRIYVCKYIILYHVISTMGWDLPLISGVSDLQWLHWNATFFYLNHRFEVVVTLRGKLI